MLAPAETCSVVVEFRASTAGDRDASLAIIGSTSATASLSGLGIAPPSRIRFTPGSRNFGDVAVGASGAPFTFSVKNEDAPTMLTASIVGAGAAAFRIASTDCTGTVLPFDGTCSVTVQLEPGIGGDFVAQVVLTATNGSTAKAGLTGASTMPLALGPFTGLFAQYVFGQPAAADQETFIVTNTGTATTGPISATVIGMDAVDFTIRSTSCTTLAPAATCEVVVELVQIQFSTAV